MFLEPVIAFFPLWDLRKILPGTSPLHEWDNYRRLAMGSVVALVIIENTWPVKEVTMWVWHLVIFVIVGTIYLKEVLFAARTLMWAVLPFSLLSFFNNILKLSLGERYKDIDAYLGSAIICSIIWMITMLVISKKQHKALEAERQKTHDEEEQKY